MEYISEGVPNVCHLNYVCREGVCITKKNKKKLFNILLLLYCPQPNAADTQNAYTFPPPLPPLPPLFQEKIKPFHTPQNFFFSFLFFPFLSFSFLILFLFLFLSFLLSSHLLKKNKQKVGVFFLDWERFFKMARYSIVLVSLSSSGLE